MADTPTRQRILDAALDLFGARGVDAVSLDEIARDVGVRKQTVLYWFPSKDELVAAVLEAVAAELVVVIDAAVRSAGDDPLLSARFLKVGATDFLAKPFQPEEFLCRVNQNVEMIETITAHEPEKHMSGTLEAPGMHATMQVNFVDKGDRTGIRFSSNFKGRSILMWLMLPFMKGAIKKRSCGDLETFKRMVEAGELRG